LLAGLTCLPGLALLTGLPRLHASLLALAVLSVEVLTWWALHWLGLTRVRLFFVIAAAGNQQTTGRHGSEHQ
jgi:hypothetical protein